MEGGCRAGERGNKVRDGLEPRRKRIPDASLMVCIERHFGKDYVRALEEHYGASVSDSEVDEFVADLYLYARESHAPNAATLAASVSKRAEYRMREICAARRAEVRN